MHSGFRMQQRCPTVDDGHTATFPACSDADFPCEWSPVLSACLETHEGFALENDVRIFYQSNEVHSHLNKGPPRLDRQRKGLKYVQDPTGE